MHTIVVPNATTMGNFPGFSMDSAMGMTDSYKNRKNINALVRPFLGQIDRSLPNPMPSNENVAVARRLDLTLFVLT